MSPGTISTETAAYLRAQVPKVLPGRPVIGAITPYTDEVWCIEAEDGRKVVAKQQLFGFLTRGKAYDLLSVECEVLGLLRSAGCPVPRVLGVDEDQQCIFYSWLGDDTYDDSLQTGDTALIWPVIDGMCAIDRVCAQYRDRLAPRVVPSAGHDELAAGWGRAGEEAREGIRHLLRRIGRPSSAAEEMLTSMHTWLAGRPPALGSTDYNARNIVVGSDGSTVRFIEFAKIGWDWTERRLVQYTTSMGSGRADGRMRSVLREEVALYYAEISGRSDGARALDYHQIFFLLNGVAMLCSAFEGGPRAAALLAHWREPMARLRQFATMLGRALSGDPLAAEFRGELHACLTPDGDRL